MGEVVIWLVVLVICGIAVAGGAALTRLAYHSLRGTTPPEAIEAPQEAPRAGDEPLYAPDPNCLHTAEREPVEVAFTAGEDPQVVGWLCSACLGSVPPPVDAPPPPPPALTWGTREEYQRSQRELRRRLQQASEEMRRMTDEWDVAGDHAVLTKAQYERYKRLVVEATAIRDEITTRERAAEAIWS